MHEPYLFIEDKDCKGKDNEEYFQFISDFRKEYGFKSKSFCEKSHPYFIENQECQIKKLIHFSATI